LPKVHLSFELTRTGILNLNKAEVKIEETYTVEEKVKIVKEDAVTEEPATDAPETVETVETVETDE
jgi:hypothetical protein